MMRSKIFLSIFFSVFLFVSSQAQDEVTFKAKDGLTVYATEYIVNKDKPYILLFHQAGYSKGEYREIAPKLLKLGYNCLAVDLRSGGDVNFVPNETASEARKLNFLTSYLDAKQDIEAAIDYICNKSNQPVILFGSSYSASLVLLIGKTNEHVKAIIAFSPGEYLKPDVNMALAVEHTKKPVFAACSQREFVYVDEMLKGISPSYKTIFKPQDSPGTHGAKALWSSCKASNEYWLALYLFFKKLK